MCKKVEFDHLVKKFCIRLSRNISENRFFWLYGLLWCVISFGFELFNFTWSVDDELFAYAPDGAAEWIVQGRFTSGYVLGIVFRNLSLPFFSLFFAQICMLAAYYLIWVREKSVSGPLHYLALPLFMASPLLFYVYTFSCLTPVIGFGFLCSAAAVCLFASRRWYSVVGGLLCGGVAVGCYQLFMVCIVLLLILRLLEELPAAGSREFLKRLGGHMIFALGVLITYFVMLKSILFFSGMKMSSYITEMVPAAQDISSQSLSAKISGLLLRGWNFFVDNIWSDLACAVILFVLCGSLVVISRRWCKEDGGLWRFLFFTVLNGALVVLPLIFYCFNRNGIAGLRTVIPLIIALPSFFIAAWESGKFYRRSVLMVLAVLTIGQFLYLNSKFSYICYLRNQKDRQVAADIAGRLLPEIRSVTTAQVPLLIVGGRALDVNEKQFITGKQFEAIGSSVFNWGNGDNKRVVRYFNQHLTFDFRIPAISDYELVKGELAAMPCYPAAGSVRYIRGVAVVKFAECPSIPAAYFEQDQL